jgi:hypothetical protein
LNTHPRDIDLLNKPIYNKLRLDEDDLR